MKVCAIFNGVFLLSSVQIAMHLSTVDADYRQHGWKESARGKWLAVGTGKPASFYRQPYFDQLWVRLLDPISTMYFASWLPSVVDDRWKDSILWRALGALSDAGLRTLLLQPFEVACLHYSLQPPGSQLNFRSTLDAMSRLASYNPFYLWSGVLETLVARSLHAVVLRELNVRIGPHLHRKRFGKIFVDFLRTCVEVALISPFRVISIRAMCNTPLLRQLPGFVQYSQNPIEHAKHIWATEGLAGFYRGALFIFASRAISIVIVNIWLNFACRRALARRRAPVAFVVPMLAALSFASDLNGLRGLPPWADPSKLM